MVEAEEMRSDVGSKDGAEVAPAEGVVTDNEGIGDAGVEEGAKSNPVPAKEGKAVATATVDDLDYGGVRTLLVFTFPKDTHTNARDSL